MAAQRVLGIDPGTTVAGWGVLESTGPGSVRRLGSGFWRLGARLPIATRLARLHDEVERLLAEWKPDLLALEAAFFGRNARSALRLGEARGVILACAAGAGLEIVELPPALVKRRVGGSGAVSKQGLSALVAAQLGIEQGFEAADESDALAVALCAVLERKDGKACFRHNGKGLPRGAAPQ